MEFLQAQTDPQVTSVRQSDWHIALPKLSTDSSNLAKQAQALHEREHDDDAWVLRQHSI